MSKSLKNYTVAELKLMAREAGIELPDRALKADIVAALETQGNNVITANTTNPSGNPSVGVSQGKDGVIGSAAADKKEKLPPIKRPRRPHPESTKSKVALYSEKNLSWVGVGKLKHGYNFVSKEASERWLRHRAVRKAEPEEVARYYGVN